jgi:hypothetical protein
MKTIDSVLKKYEITRELSYVSTKRLSEIDKQEYICKNK